MRLKLSESVISEQKDKRADNRRKVTEEVQSIYTGGSEGIEQPASGHGANNSEQEVWQNALSSSLYKPAAYEPRRQTENYPDHK